jgi:plasmid stabilization system protein ParE
MNIEFRDSFVNKLNRQIGYIASDKPIAARKFKKEILERCKSLTKQPFKCKKSIYFNDETITDLTFKGFTIVYKINAKASTISVFALVKYEEGIK